MLQMVDPGGAIVPAVDPLRANRRNPIGELLTDLGDSASCCFDHLLQHFHGDRAIFTSTDHLHHFASGSADQVQIQGGTTVLLVVEIDS